MPLGSLALAPPLINEAARRRQREHNAYMSTMAVRQQQLTERLLSLDDGLEALERLADLGDIAANEERSQKGLSASDMSLLVCRWATDEDNETCPICLGEPAVGDRLCTLACCHTFHHKCVTQWLTVSALCPLCKSHALGEEESQQPEPVLEPPPPPPPPPPAPEPATLVEPMELEATPALHISPIPDRAAAGDHAARALSHEEVATE